MDKVVETKLVEARVYRRGATLVRVGTVSLEQGNASVYLTGMPSGIDRESVRVKFPQTVSQGTVQVVDAEEAGLLDEARQEREGLLTEVKRLEKRIANKEAQRDLWLHNADFTSNSSVPIDERIAFLSDLPTKLDELDGEIAKLTAERDEVRGKLSTDLVSENGQYLKNALLLEMEALQAGECRFEVSYQIPSASWRPFYELRVDGVDAPVVVKLRAEVMQSSGENWEDVHLVLSSGDTLASFGIPEVRPLYVDFWHNKPPMPMQPMPLAAASSRPSIGFGAHSAPRADSPSKSWEPDETLIELAAPTAKKSSEQTLNTYDLPGTWDIESRGRGRLVDLSVYELAADYRMVCAPCEDDGAYLAARVSDLGEIDLFECEAAIYLEGSYVGATMIDPDAVSGDELLPLGRDERVRVSRKRTQHLTSTPALLGKTKVESAFEITVRNRRPDAVHMSVHDRIPVSRDKDITVTATQLSGGSIDEETGEITWDFTMEAGAEKTIALAYTIAYPKGAELDTSLGNAKPHARALAKPRKSDPETTKTFCPVCGASTDFGTVFCPKCGSLLHN